MRLLAMTLAACLAVACHGNSVTGNTALTQSGDFTITISAGTTPTFSWPGGNANAISVSKIDPASTPNWDSYSDTSLGFASPVTFGTRPPNTSTTQSNVLPLIKGTHYYVIVFRADGRQALREFVP